MPESRHKPRGKPDDKRQRRNAGVTSTNSRSSRLKGDGVCDDLFARNAQELCAISW